MKQFKNTLAALLALSLTAALSACGGTPATSSSSAAASSSAPASSDASASSDAPAATTTIVVGASPAPHAEILEAVKPVLAEQGITLEIKEFTDYVIPNMALEEGDLDANYFQHLPYLENFNTENNTKLSSAVAVHFEPLGVYPGKTASIEALADGAIIAVPSDPTNEARALQTLQTLGLIKLKDGVGLNATPLDIVENPKNITFKEIEAAQLPRTLPDVDLAVINGNYALDGGVADTMLASEDPKSEAAQKFANILAVRTGDESRPEIQALVKALTSETAKKFINDTYTGTVLPVF